MNVKYARAVACATMFGAASATLWAQSNPWYLGASIGYYGESNLFRTTTGQVSDTSVVTSLLAGLDQPIGRQRVRANVTLRDNRYRDRSDLNYQGYGVSAGVDWATIGNLSGSIDFSANQTLAQFNPGDAPDIRKKNVQRNQSLSLTTRLGTVTRLTFDASLSASDLRYSAPEFDFRELRQVSGTLGASYAFSNALAVGGSIGLGSGRYPLYTPTQADEFDTDSFSLRGSWRPSGSSTVSATISSVHQKHDQARARDYRGSTGAVRWDWQAGGRTSFAFRLSRDLGSDSTVYTVVGPITGETDNSRVTTGLTANGSYRLTDKIGLKANLGYFSRSIADINSINSNQIGATRGRDRTTVAGVGATWAPMRSLSVGCDIGLQDRSSSDLPSLAFRNESYSCFVQALLQ